MSRIAKSAVYASFDRAASLLRAADTGHDGRISRAEVRQALTQLSGTERELVDMFYRFVDHRDAAPYAKVTATDLSKAVAYAKAHMVDTYDVNHNGLSSAEIARMSRTAQLTVELAKETKAAAAAAAATSATPETVQWL